MEKYFGGILFVDINSLHMFARGIYNFCNDRFINILMQFAIF